MNVKLTRFFRKFPAFLKLKKSGDRQLFLLGLAFLTAFLCLVSSPGVAQIPASGVDEQNQAIAQVRELQALGHYRQACGILLQALAVPEIDCQTLIRDGASERAEELFQTIPTSAITATELRMLGDVLRVVGAVNTSEKVLELSLEMAAESDISAVHFSLGNTKRALGKRRQYLNERQAEKAYYKAALEHYEGAIASATSESARLRVTLRKLSLLIETESNSNRTDFWRDVKSQVDNLPDNLEAVNIRIDLANSLTCLKVRSGEFTLASNSTNFQPAIARLCKPSETIETRKNASLENYAVPEWQEIGQLLAIASRQAEQLGDARSHAYALGNLGELYELNQQYSTAQKLTEEAISIAQSIRAPDIEYKWLWQLGRLHINLGNMEAAIAAYTEAFNTLQNLRKDLASLNRDVQFSFRDEVEPIYRELVDLLLKAEQPSQENLQKARKAIEALQLAELDDFFRDACSDAKPIAIDKIDPTAAVIYPIILENRLDVILSLPEQGLSHYTTPTPTKNLKEIIADLRATLELNYESSYLPLSKQLYKLLMPPEMEALLQAKANPSIKTLVFVLDGELRNIPMAVLYDEKSQQYLIQKYTIALTPSLQLIAPKSVSREQLSALIAGATDAPSFEKEGFNPLPNVKIELEQIEKELQQKKQLFEPEFSKINIQKQIQSIAFNIVHLATHGKFSSNLEETYILDWNERININQLNELLQNKSRLEPIELLVLSACETAQGDNRAALGLAGVAVRSGARSTLATLWNVNDKSTADFMSQFYRQLIETNGTKAEALRSVQNAFLNNEDYKHPRFWAPFVLVGNWL